MNAYFFRKLALSFGRAFLGALIPGLVALQLPISTGSIDEIELALFAVLAASVTAGFRAVQALVTNLETDAIHAKKRTDPYE